VPPSPAAAAGHTLSIAGCQEHKIESITNRDEATQVKGGDNASEPAEPVGGGLWVRGREPVVGVDDVHDVLV
jgi:hypothetical protein